MTDPSKPGVTLSGFHYESDDSIGTESVRWTLKPGTQIDIQIGSVVELVSSAPVEIQIRRTAD